MDNRGISSVCFYPISTVQQWDPDHTVQNVQKTQKTVLLNVLYVYKNNK